MPVFHDIVKVCSGARLFEPARVRRRAPFWRRNRHEEGGPPMTIRTDRTGDGNDLIHGPLSSISAVRRTAPPRAERNGDRACPFRRLQRAIRKAERPAAAGRDTGTGATVLRLTAAPLARLIERRRIGGEEARAAADIATAFHAQAGAVMIKSPSLEKRDASYQACEPFRVIDAVARYKPWARHWSQRARRGDRTLEIIVAAVIDERAFHIIEADAGIRHGMAARATIAGLRDYAARAGWTDRRTADTWIGEAEAVFTLRPAAGGKRTGN
jgi:hypothetical protein